MKKTVFLISGMRGQQRNQIWIDDKEILPGRSQKVRNHSPDGFNWGYGGSGPAQTALAICLEILPTEQAALGLYQQFKWAFVALWKEDDFMISIDITDFLRKHYPEIQD